MVSHVVDCSTSIGCVHARGWCGAKRRRQCLTRSDHHMVAFGMAAQPKSPVATDGKAVLVVKALRTLVFLVDAEPHALRTPACGRTQRCLHQRRRDTRAVM